MNILEWVCLKDQEICLLAGFEGSELSTRAQDLRGIPRGANNRLHGCEAGFDRQLQLAMLKETREP